MLLSGAIANLPGWPTDAIIFAKLRDGKFHPDSEALVLELVDSWPNFRRFLRVPVARSVESTWRDYHQRQEPTFEQLLETTTA